jgi:hypothetical protein
LLTTQAVDTATYVNYRGNLLNGVVDPRRTPVYPYFIKLVSLFGPAQVMDNVVIVQCILSLLSIVVFYKPCQLILKSRSVIIAATLFYGLLLPVINFDKIVITESLSVVFIVGLIYLLISYLHRPQQMQTLLITLMVLLCIMLRPAFIYLLPLITLFWLLRWLMVKAERKFCLWGLGSLAAVLLLIIGYGQLNKKGSGFNGISIISINNQMAVIINAGIYNDGNDAPISAAIAHNLKLPLDSTGKRVPGINIMKIYPPQRVCHFIVTCIKNRPGAYLLNIYSTMAKLRGQNIFTNYALHKVNRLAFWVEDVEYMLFCVTHNILYLFLLLVLVLIITQWIKRRQIPGCC